VSLSPPRPEPIRPKHEHATDLGLAALLAALPLLPTGAQYIGWPHTTWWVEAVLPALLLLLLLAWRDARRAQVLSRSIPGAIIGPFILAITGAAAIAILSDNVPGSSAFVANLRDLPHQVFAPIDQVTDPLYALRVWLTLVEGPAAFVIVVLLCRFSSDPGRRARAALGGAAAGMALVSVFALLQYATRFHLNPHWTQAEPNLVRSQSTLDDPNTLGSYLVFGIGIAAGLAMRDRIGDIRRRRGWLTTAVVLLGVSALVTTVSRAALGALVLAPCLLIAAGPRSPQSPARTRLRVIARASLMFAGVAAALWLAARVWLPGRAEYRPAGPLQAVLQTIDPRSSLDEVLKGREVLWTAALALARRHPVAGVGLGRFPRLIAEQRHFPVRVDNTHNFFLQLLVETGVAGLSAFLLIVAGLAWRLREAIRGSGPDAALAWGASIAALGLALTLLSGQALLLPSMQIVVGTSLAAVLAATAGAPAVARGPFGRRAPLAAVAVIAVIYGAVLSRTTWQGASSPFGYTAGLYALEYDPEWHPFRWTGRDAFLYLPVPDGATAMLLDVAAFPPDAGQSATVTIRAAGTDRSVVLTDGAWRQLAIPLADSANRSRSVDIAVHVDRVAVPAMRGDSGDARSLGVQLRPPFFSLARADRGR
jgi:O-antigen ligase